MRVCMITHSAYEIDNRVIRYAEALAARGDSVEVIALRRSPDLEKEEIINGVRIHRIQDRFQKRERSLREFLWPLCRFLVKASRCATRLHKQKPFSLIHVHNFPDFMVFAAWYPKLRGAKVILDIHDLMPEFVESKMARRKSRLFSSVLKCVERVSAFMADHVILANDLWVEKYIRRAASSSKCSVFINNVDRRIFHPRARRRDDNKKIAIFPGGLQWHQGVDVAIRAFSILRSRLPESEFHIYGDGNMKAELINLAEELGLNGSVRFFEPVDIYSIAEKIAEADIGVVAKRASSFGNEAYSTKILELMASGVPVVVSNTAVDRYYFDDSEVRFFESESSDELSGAMFDILTNDQLRARMIENGSRCAARNDWTSRKDEYRELVASLCEGPDKSELAVR